MNAEQQRRLHNIATIGTVTEVNTEDQTMRLAVGDNETDFLTIPSLSAGQVRVWRCPSEGEQFLLVSPSGDLANAVPVLSLYSEANPSPSTDADEIRIRYNEQDYLSVHVKDSKLHLKINDITHEAAKGILLNTPTVTMTGDLLVQGNQQVGGSVHCDNTITADTEVTAAGVKLTNHKHDGVTPGNGKTGTPV